MDPCGTPVRNASRLDLKRSEFEQKALMSLKNLPSRPNVGVDIKKKHYYSNF